MIERTQTRLVGGWLSAIALGLMLSASPARGDDWPQWMGPQRDGVYRESGVLTEFPESGLKVRWRADIAGGYAGPAVADGKVFVTDYVRESGDATNDPGRRNELTGTERVLCFSAETGKPLWQHAYPRDYNISYPCGPRCTPAYDAGVVYTLGAEGDLFALEADSGKVVWHKQLRDEYSGEAPLWGFSGHPLVDGDKLICLVGGEGSVAVAFDKRTGKELWRNITASEAGYCPPSIIESAGKRQLLIWDADKLNALNPESGEVYWSEPLKPSYGMSIMTPQKYGRFLFASGIGDVGALFQLDADQPGASVAWTGTGRTAVYCANSTPHIDDGVIYGVNCRRGDLVAVDLEDGKRLWENFGPTTGDRPAPHGTAYLIKHEPTGRYFLFSEKGDLITAELSRDGYDEISRFHVLAPTGDAFNRPVVWSYPAFADKACFARNDKEIVCVLLAE